MRTAESVSSLLVAAADGRSIVRRLRGSPPLGLRELRRSGEGSAPARVAIVQRAAHLVGGDRVRLEVRVEEGAALELVEISATLAHGGGGPARQTIELEVGARARLCFAEQPLILAAGAELERRLTLRLAEGARAVHRDTLVLGRHGEEPGRAHARLRVERAGVPLLDETLCTDDLESLRSAAIAGDARVLGALGRYGIHGPAPEDAFAIGAGDTLVRRLASGARGLVALDGLQRAWTAALLEAGPGAAGCDAGAEANACAAQLPAPVCA
jgi:urease accessory protein